VARNIFRKSKGVLGKSPTHTMAVCFQKFPKILQKCSQMADFQGVVYFKLVGAIFRIFGFFREGVVQYN
jgi:hypothetical protein